LAPGRGLPASSLLSALRSSAWSRGWWQWGHTIMAPPLVQPAVLLDRTMQRLSSGPHESRLFPQSGNFRLASRSSYKYQVLCGASPVCIQTHIVQLDSVHPLSISSNYAVVFVLAGFFLVAITVRAVMATAARFTVGFVAMPAFD
jgi:hypothetical protein